MKITFVQHASKLSGSAWSLQKIVAELASAGRSSEVLFLRKGRALEIYDPSDSVLINGRFLLPFHGSEVSGMNIFLALRNLISLPLSVYGTLRHLRHTDLLYLNSSSLCFYAFFTRVFYPRTRIIMHLREPLSDNIFGRIIRRVANFSVDQFVAISRNELENMEPQVPCTIVYNYSESSKFFPQRGGSLHHQIRHSKSNAKFIGYFARVNEENGIEDFLEVAAMLEVRDDLVFCVYGCTEQQLVSYNRTHRNLKNVHFFPMVNEVPANLGDLDVLLVPYKVPHFSRSAVEAAMMGIPSVVYDIASLNEIVTDGQTGLVVPCNAPSAMADALERLVDAPKLMQDLKNGCREHALVNFSERNFSKIMDVILEVEK